MRKTLQWTRLKTTFLKMSRHPRENLLLDRPDRQNAQIEQYLETKLRRCHQLSQRKIPQRREAQWRSGISRQSVTTKVPRHRINDTDHPLEAEATEAIEEEEGLLEDIRGRVTRVRLPSEDGDIRDRPGDTADTLCPGVGAAPDTIVTDLLAGGSRHPQGAEKLILDVDRAQSGDSNVDGLDHDPP